MSEIQVKVQEVTEENIRPYGTLIDTNGKKADFVSEAFSYWDALEVVETAERISFGIVESYPGPMAAVNLERHSMTSETLIPLDVDIVLVVGVPTNGGRADTTSVDAFRIPRGKAVTLGVGTWHYVPLVRDRPGKTMVVFRAGTPSDDLLVDDFEETRGEVIRVLA